MLHARESRICLSPPRAVQRRAAWRIGAAMPMLAQGSGAGQAQVHALRPPSRPCAAKAVLAVKGKQKGKGRGR